MDMTGEILAQMRIVRHSNPSKDGRGNPSEYAIEEEMSMFAN
jgi:hypothetical protein